MKTWDDFRDVSLEVAKRILETERPPDPEPLGSYPVGTMDRLARLMAKHDFTLLFEDLEAKQRGLKGLTNHMARTVSIDLGLSETAATRVMIHETAHLLLHDPFRHVPAADREFVTTPLDRRLYAEFGPRAFRDACEQDWSRPQGVDECEAEGTAWLVSDALGVDTSGFSVPYVVEWLQGDAKGTLEAAANVARATETILAALR